MILGFLINNIIIYNTRISSSNRGHILNKWLQFLWLPDTKVKQIMSVLASLENFSNKMETYFPIYDNCTSLLFLIGPHTSSKENSFILDPAAHH